MTKTEGMASAVRPAPLEEGERAARIEETLTAAIRAHERFRSRDPAPLLAAADLMIETLGRGGRLLAFGNGGSAADAQHFSSELVGRFERERPGLAAIALTTDASVLTSVANDYGYERVFARQIEALGRRGDVALAISTSGQSSNVRLGIEAARGAGLTTVGLTGRDGGAVAALVDVHINVPEASTARVQEVHRTILHAICDLVEAAFARQGQS